MTRRNTWKRLREGLEGPTVTVQLPREWAEELLSSLMTSLEMDDGEGDPDADLDMDMDADADMGGEMGPMEPPDMDSDDEFGGGGGFSAGEDDEPDFAAGDDDDEEEESPPPKAKKPPEKSKDKGKSKKDEPKKDDSDDDDEKDEAIDFAGSGQNVRPKTALGESSFAKLAGYLARRSPKTVRRK